jgi:hypothetical protein
MAVNHYPHLDSAYKRSRPGMQHTLVFHAALAAKPKRPGRWPALPPTQAVLDVRHEGVAHDDAHMLVLQALRAASKGGKHAQHA